MIVYLQINTVLLSAMKGDSETGIYRAAANFIFAVSAFSSAIVTSLFPAVAAAFESDRSTALRVCRQAVFTSLFFSLPIAFGTLPIADRLVAAVFKDSFRSSADILRILIWWIPLSFMTNVLGFILAAIGQQKTVLIIAAANAFVAVVINALLIPPLAGQGAAIASVATELLGCTVLFVAVIRRFGPVVQVRELLKQLSACGVMTLAVAFSLPHMHVFTAIAFGTAVFGVMAFAMRIVTGDDIQNFVRSVRIPPPTRVDSIV
jgi:O-antigen/teichoic acid export membrane protein